MNERDQLLAVLETLLGFPDTSIIVRSACAIAEVRGPLTLRRGAEWLTLGEGSGSHVHVKADAIVNMRFCDPCDGNAAHELLAHDGTIVRRTSFRKTNAARIEDYDRERAERIKTNFRHLAAWEGT
jgi:hypothetical protein